MSNQQEILDNNSKDIDKHIEDLINEILILNTELDILNDWYINNWINLVNKNMEKYKNEYESDTNNWILWDDWIKKYIFEPKKYQYHVYVRAFLDKLYVYLNKKHRDYKNNKNMWKSSKYLKYYIHLIFKTGFYNNKTYNSNKKIINELIMLISYLSNPLHGFSIYFNKKYISKTDEDMEKNINDIVDLILKKSINSDVIKQPIDLNIEGKKQKYLNCVTWKILDKPQIKNFLSFLEKYFLKDFEESIEESKKWLEIFKNK